MRRRISPRSTRSARSAGCSISPTKSTSTSLRGRDVGSAGAAPGAAAHTISIYSISKAYGSPADEWLHGRTGIACRRRQQDSGHAADLRAARLARPPSARCGRDAPTATARRHPGGVRSRVLERLGGWRSGGDPDRGWRVLLPAAHPHVDGLDDARRRLIVGTSRPRLDDLRPDRRVLSSRLYGALEADTVDEGIGRLDRKDRGRLSVDGMWEQAFSPCNPPSGPAGLKPCPQRGLSEET